MHRLASQLIQISLNTFTNDFALQGKVAVQASELFFNLQCTGYLPKRVFGCFKQFQIPAANTKLAISQIISN